MKISSLALTGTLSGMLATLIYQSTIKPISTDNDAWVAEANVREEKLNQELEPYIKRNKRLAQETSNNSTNTTGSELNAK